MNRFNLSALAVREQSITLFLIVAILVAIVTASGREARGADLSTTTNQPA